MGGKSLPSPRGVGLVFFSFLFLLVDFMVMDGSLLGTSFGMVTIEEKEVKKFRIR